MSNMQELKQPCLYYVRKVDIRDIVSDFAWFKLLVAVFPLSIFLTNLAFWFSIQLSGNTLRPQYMYICSRKSKCLLLICIYLILRGKLKRRMGVYLAYKPTHSTTGQYIAESGVLYMISG